MLRVKAILFWAVDARRNVTHLLSCDDCPLRTRLVVLCVCIIVRQVNVNPVGVRAGGDRTRGQFSITTYSSPLSASTLLAPPPPPLTSWPTTLERELKHITTSTYPHHKRKWKMQWHSGGSELGRWTRRNIFKNFFTWQEPRPGSPPHKFDTFSVPDTQDTCNV